MSQLAPPPVPAKLLEMLKDYPGHIEQLHETLNRYVEKPSRSIPFDGAIWVLEAVLESFYSEARQELKVAEASSDPDAISRAKDKKCLMGEASFKGAWLGYTDDLQQYLDERFGGGA